MAPQPAAYRRRADRTASRLRPSAFAERSASRLALAVPCWLAPWFCLEKFELTLCLTGKPVLGGRSIVREGGYPPRPRVEERMVRVNRQAVRVAALERQAAPGAERVRIVAGVRLRGVAARAHAHEPLERRERITTAGDAHAMVDDARRDDEPAPLARLAQGTLCELRQAQPSPRRCRVGPISHDPPSRRALRLRRLIAGRPFGGAGQPACPLPDRLKIVGVPSVVRSRVLPEKGGSVGLDPRSGCRPIPASCSSVPSARRHTSSPSKRTFPHPITKVVLRIRDFPALGPEGGENARRFVDRRSPVVCRQSPETPQRLRRVAFAERIDALEFIEGRAVALPFVRSGGLWGVILLSSFFCLFTAGFSGALFSGRSAASQTAGFSVCLISRLSAVAPS